MAWLFNTYNSRVKRMVCAQRDSLYRLAYAWTHNPHLADDLVQQAIVKALSNQKQLRDQSSIKPWLYRILSNCYADYFRTLKETIAEDSLELEDNNTPYKDAHKQETVNSVRQGISQLPLAQRQVITLVVLEGLSYAEVAEVLDIPVGTVMSRLSRARGALKQHLSHLQSSVANEAKTKLTRIK